MSEDEGLTNSFSKTKVQKFKKEWERVEADAASEIGSIMKGVKDAKDGILESAEAIGIKKSVFKKVMKKAKLLRQAEEVRSSIDDEEVVDQFDNVQLAAGLPLFDMAPSEPRKRKGPDLDKIADAMDAEDGTTEH